VSAAGNAPGRGPQAAPATPGVGRGGQDAQEEILSGLFGRSVGVEAGSGVDEDSSRSGTFPLRPVRLLSRVRTSWAGHW